MRNAPSWAQRQTGERAPAKAARLAALYLLRDELPSIPKVQMAARLGVSRWTYDRLLADVSEVESQIEQVREAIEG